MDQAKPKLDRLPPEVSENIAEYLQGDHESLEAFRALRLSCKELYLKTFRVFAIAYFADLSVAFTYASLRRLRDVAKHKNSFGLSLYTFPRSLTCSTYRLPMGNAVEKCLITTSDPDRTQNAVEVADAISRACKKRSGLFGTFLAPYDHPRIRELARQYVKAAAEQSSIESTGDDVQLIANALAALPNVRSIGVRPDRHAWGQDDWDALAGIKIESFLYVEYLASGETNLTITARKLLAAVAEADVLCKSQGDQLIIEQVDLQGGYDAECENVECAPNNLQLHKLNITNPLQTRLKDALSQLKRLYISVCRLTRHTPPQTNIYVEFQQSETALQALFGNPATEEFCLDLFEPPPRDLTGLVSIERSLLDVAIETQSFTSLRSIELYCPALQDHLPAVCQYVRAHATTLKELHLGSCRGSLHPDVGANRELWRPVLQTAAGCAEIVSLVVWIRTEIVDVYDVDIAVKGKEDVSELLAKLVASPTEPGKELGWVR